MANTSQKTAKSQKTPEKPPLEKIVAHRDWDYQADAFVMNAHQFGQTASQIAENLVQNGYKATETNVVDIWHRQGLQEGVPTFRWNAQADQFALAAAGMGHSVSQITSQLCENGYTATTADVVASLQRQGWGICLGDDSQIQ